MEYEHMEKLPYTEGMGSIRKYDDGTRVRGKSDYNTTIEEASRRNYMKSELQKQIPRNMYTHSH